MTPDELDDPARRRFLQLMGASLALAGGACSGPPPERIVPYVDLPPQLRDGGPVDARGVAQLRLLLCDGRSPCYVRTEPDALAAAVDTALSWLSPPG